MTATRRSVRRQRAVTTRPAVDRLSRPPHEILHAIFRLTGEKSQLSAVCRVSKLFHALATPLLYTALEIQCREGFNPRLPELRRFCGQWPEVKFTPNLKYVRDLAVTTEVKNLVRPGERCWHYRLQRKELEEDRQCSRLQGIGGCDLTDCPSPEAKCGENNAEQGETDGSETDEECPCERCAGDSESDWDEEPDFYEDYFRDFCLGLSENSLRSFRWELGACVPQNILGSLGCLTQRQGHLERLSLITDGACDNNMEYEYSYDLAKFDRIRDFSWVGSQSKEDFEAMRACLTINAKHLEILKLDLLDWLKADDFWYLDHTRLSDRPGRSDNFFARDILGYRTRDDDDDDGDDAGIAGLAFATLQSLYLGQLSFRPVISDLAGAFNMSALKRLVIWNCPGSTQLLEHLSNVAQSLQLISFELTCGYDDPDDQWSIQFAVPPFLQKWADLQTLCLSLPVIDWTDIINSVGTHVERLERLVLHARTINIDEDSPYHETEEDLQMDFYPGFFDLFAGGICEAIGITISPDFLRKCLESYAEDVECKLLHFRVSRDNLMRQNTEVDTDRNEVDSFADWGFGPQGFPQLLVLAYGDFAFEQSCHKYNVLYCRITCIGQGQESTHYEVLTPSNEELWKWTMTNMHVLSACPYQPILQV